MAMFLHSMRQWSRQFNSKIMLWLGALVLLIIAAYAPIIFGYPHPYYNVFVPADNNWFDVSFRSVFLRLNDLPGLVGPLSSGEVAGHDYIYTSTNLYFLVLFSLPLKIASWFFNLDAPFTFLIATRVLIIVLNAICFYFLYRLLTMVYKNNRTNLRIILLLLFVSWPIIIYVDTPRWFPLIMLNVFIVLLLSIKLLQNFNWKLFIGLSFTLFVLASLHYYGVVYSLALAGYLLIASKKELRWKMSALLLAAIIGAVVHTSPIYYYTDKYDKGGDKETGASTISLYVKTWPEMWRAMALSSLGKEEFHINLHGVIPNVMSDVSHSILPTPPENFTKIRELLGFRWSRWSNYMGDGNWYKYQAAIISFFLQIALWILFGVIFFGFDLFKMMRRLISVFKLQSLKEKLNTVGHERKMLYFFIAVNFLLYLFLYFRIEQEPYARYGLFIFPIAVFLAELTAINSTDKKNVLARMAYLTVCVVMALSFQVYTKTLKPAAMPEFQAYKRMVGWAAAHADNRQLYFDFSDYYYLTAKVLIDGPTPYRGYAYPNLKNEWDYRETYGDEPTYAIGISADMPSDKAESLQEKFKIGNYIDLNEIPNRGLGTYYMPRRPDKAKILLEYVDRAEISGKNRFVYFYTGQIFTE